ncbi:MAG: hypothetical protein MUF04_07135, partial [Akkermansiaceae bacterium]|nr:hypothetical protein [Akkermansiaceae bacterium]
MTSFTKQQLLLLTAACLGLSPLPAETPPATVPESPGQARILGTIADGTPPPPAPPKPPFTAPADQIIESTTVSEGGRRV